MAIVTGDRYLDALVKFVENNAEALIEGSLVLKLNPVGLRYVHSRFEALGELESLIAGAPVDYLRAYVSDLGDHRAIEQLRRIMRLLPSLKVVSRLPHPIKDPTPLSLLPFARLKVLELRGCDLSTSAAHGLLELRYSLEKLICHNSTDALRHIFASRIAEIKDSPQWNRLSFISCACNGLVLMDESLQLLPAVETLDLSRNKFAKVDNLRKCAKLKHLDLGFNQLRTIASFSEVSFHIVKLVLRNNALRTLHGIEHLKSLEGLDLSYNIISNLSEIEILAGIPSLQSLWLEGNPLCTARWYRAHVFSFFPCPDKLKLDERKFSTSEFWKRQIIIASRQKRPASFGLYSPAKYDAEFAANAITKRKSISRVVSIESEFQTTCVFTDRDSVTDNGSQIKEEKEDPNEEAGVDNLMKRIEFMKEERSALWLQELEKWMNTENWDDGVEHREIIPHHDERNSPRSKITREHLDQRSRDILDPNQASGDESSITSQDLYTSFADTSIGSSSQQYFHRVGNAASNCLLGHSGGDSLPITPSMTLNWENHLSSTSKGCQTTSPRNSQCDSLLFPSGERITAQNLTPLTAIEDVIESHPSSACPGSPPHYQEDILLRRQNLEEEFLQLSADSLSMVSSDSDTSCSDADSSDWAQCQPEVNQYLIDKYSTRNLHASASSPRAKADYNKHILPLKQNGVVPSLAHGEGDSWDARVSEFESSPYMCSNEFSECFHGGGSILSTNHEDVLSEKKTYKKKPKKRIVSLLMDNGSDQVESLSESKGNIDLSKDDFKTEMPEPGHISDAFSSDAPESSAWSNKTRSFNTSTTRSNAPGQIVED